MYYIDVSVADPDPNPPDPHVFGPPGSGSTSQRNGSGSGSCSGSWSFYHHAKIVRKNLDSYYFVTSFDFLSMKNDVNVASKSNKQKKLWWKISFLLASWRSMTKIAGSGSRIRIQDPDPDPLVRGMDPRIRIHPKMSWIRNTDWCIYL